MPGWASGEGYQSLIDTLEAGTEAVLFTGAGISVQAGVPAASDVVDKLRIRNPAAFRAVDDPEYIEAWETLLPGEENRGERRAIIERLFMGAAPTTEHYRIAQFVESDLIDGVVTTNFDHLLEFAFNAHCDRTVRIYTHKADISRRDLAEPAPKIIKIHGDFLFDNLANLPYEMERRVKGQMRTVFEDYLRERALVVVGYAGDDETIMGLLEEAAGSTDRLTGGLWWVSYSPLDLDEEENEQIKAVLEAMDQADKPAHLITPNDGRLPADEFFDTVGSDLGLSSPNHVPFGVGEARNHFPDLNISQISRPRQRPPETSPPLSRLPDPYTTLRDEVTQGNHVIVRGPQMSGKTRLVSTLVRDSDVPPVFYFSPRFAETPIRESFVRDLVHFANSLGVALESRSHVDIAKSLAAEGIIFVFDDITDRVQIENISNIIEIISAIEGMDQGSLVLVLSDRTPDGLASHLALARSEDGDELFADGPPTFSDLGFTTVRTAPAEQQGDLNAAIQARLDSCPDDVHDLLSTLALLRRSEPPDMIAKLIDGEQVSDTLSQLVDDGLVERQGREYLPRKQVSRVVRNILAEDGERQARKRTIGLRFKYLSNEEYRSRWFHYSRESEIHLREGGAYAAGLSQLVYNYNQESNMGYDYAIYNLFESYFTDLFSDWFYEDLPPSEQFSALLGYYRAWSSYDDSTGVAAPPKFNEIELNCKQRWEPWRRSYFDGELERVRGNPKASREELERAEAEIRSTGPPSALASIQATIAGFYSPSVDMAWADPGKLEAYHIESLEWLRSAEETFERLGDSKQAAMCEGDRAAIFLERDEYLASRETSLGVARIINRDHGFSRDKAANYSRLFSTNLALAGKTSDDDWRADRLRKAEGYFFESNLNALSRGDFEGLIQNISNLLFATVDPKKQCLRQDDLPPEDRLYDLIFIIWHIDRDQFSPLVDRTIMVMFKYLIYKKEIEKIIEWLSFAENLFEYYRKNGESDRAIAHRLSVLGNCHETFGGEVTRENILNSMNMSDKEKEICECYLTAEDAPEKELGELDACDGLNRILLSVVHEVLQDS